MKFAYGTVLKKVVSVRLENVDVTYSFASSGLQDQGADNLVWQG